MGGPKPPRSIQRVVGYVLSLGLFTGIYLATDSIIEENRRLLQRRLAVLREQRALGDEFFNFGEEGADEGYRYKISREGLLLNYLEKYGAPSK